MMLINLKLLLLTQNKDFEVTMHKKEGVFFSEGFRLSGGTRAGPRLAGGVRAGPIWAPTGPHAYHTLIKPYCSQPPMLRDLIEVGSEFSSEKKKKNVNKKTL